MAYWQFDLTFVNLEALPAGADNLTVQGIFASPYDYVGVGLAVSPPGSLTASMNTIDDVYDPFELAPSEKVWFMVDVEASGQRVLSTLLGPYTVGDIGTEVPAP